MEYDAPAKKGRTTGATLHAAQPKPMTGPSRHCPMQLK